MLNLPLKSVFYVLVLVINLLYKTGKRLKIRVISIACQPLKNFVGIGQ